MIRSAAPCFPFVVLAASASANPALDFVSAARAQVGVTLRYDPAYTVLTYPGGDVPMERGVCTDVIVRAMRKLGIDLQRDVHEEMARSFSVYPHLWDLRRPDRNIDHRRVPNLMCFFERKGKKLPIGKAAGDFQPGDLVTCTVPPRLPHIMVVSDRRSPTDPERPLVIHNIGAGAQEEDALFEYPHTGHYRWWRE